jgi:hypothetical protein
MHPLLTREPRTGRKRSLPRLRRALRAGKSNLPTSACCSGLPGARDTANGQKLTRLSLNLRRDHSSTTPRSVRRQRRCTFQDQTHIAHRTLRGTSNHIGMVPRMVPSTALSEKTLTRRDDHPWNSQRRMLGEEDTIDHVACVSAVPHSPDFRRGSIIRQSSERWHRWRIGPCLDL